MTDDHTIIPRADVAPTRIVIHPLIAQMMAKNPSVADMREFIALQREWQADEAKRAFTIALMELKRDLPAFLHRDKTVAFESRKGGADTFYKHTSLAAMMETVTPILIKHGFSLTWDTPTPSKPGLIAVAATLTHREGHSKSAMYEAPPESGGNKSAPQAVASTVTMLQRYTALSLLGLATADMEEPTHKDEAVDTGRINSNENLRLVGEIAKAGKTKEAAEALVGRPLQKWTTADLDKIRKWIVPPAAPAPAAPKGKPATREQVDTLFKDAKANGWNEEQVKAQLRLRGIKSSSELTEEIFLDLHAYMTELNP